MSLGGKAMRVGMLAGLLALLGVGVGPAMADHELWRIGSADGDTADLALGPDGYAQFAGDPLFIVGVDDPQTRWPYVHPGPHDTWAGSRAHAFSVVFGLAAAPAAPARLEVQCVDTHGSGPPRLDITINGRGSGQLTCPRGAGDASVKGDPKAGKPWRFSVDIPADALRAGNNVLRIANVAGSWLLYDSLALVTAGELETKPVEPSFVAHGFESPPVLVRGDGELKQLVHIRGTRIGPATTARVRVGGQVAVEAKVSPGDTVVEVAVNRVKREQTVDVAVSVDGSPEQTGSVVLRPVREWTVCIIHHTHLDIGYTHTQEDVEKLQMKYLDQVLELIEQTANNPPEARFTWMPEGLWAVESWLRTADTEKREAFFAAVRAGRIGLDGLYGNALTALYTDEELFALIDYARRLRREHELPLDSAMISDVPGLTWGMVPALAQSGIRYLSDGPNPGHRIGLSRVWDDRPVWWVGPSGQDRILLWQSGLGYAHFHGRRISEAAILEYLSRLEQQRFPYDIAQVRYNIGGDNGYPDTELPGFVMAWNERYAYPRLMLTTNSGMFHMLEDRYGDQLPAISGDFTPYWEDGAASTAAATSAERAADELLVQAGALYAMLAPKHYPRERVHEAWRQAVLYDEHTWGAHNSISEPDSPFAVQQDAYKQRFATTARDMARQILDDALAGIRADGPVVALEVLNPSSWPRTQLVVLPKEWSLPGDRIRRGERVVPSQRLTTGELAFLAEGVPPYGSLGYTVEPGPATALGHARAQALTLENGPVSLSVNPKTGAIASLTVRGLPGNLVDTTAESGLNAYVYIAGRDPKSRQGVSDVRVRIVEPGPLVASLQVESKAAGAYGLSTEIRLVSGLPHVEIANALDKAKVREKEGVHFAFPFAVPDATPRIETPWAIYRSDVDQLEGSCRNYLTAQRFADVSNGRLGVTLVTVDAPLVQVGEIRTDVANQFGASDSWIRRLPASSTLYSYIMNNYWETNYKADQSGVVPFRYAIRPYAGLFDGAAASRFGAETCQPLVVVPVRRPTDRASQLRVSPPGVIATSLRPSEDDSLLLRLYAASGKPESASVEWGDGSAPEVSIERPDGSFGRATWPVRLPAYGVVTLKLER